MLHEGKTISGFLDNLPQDRKEALTKLREVILLNLPQGFEEKYQDGFIYYEVPLSTFPQGYHVDGSPLPFAAIASQKHHVALYHMGIYMNQEILDWFVENYQQIVPTKLDMGKSCIRMKNVKHIPYALIGELMSKISVTEYIESYLKNRS